MNTRSELVRIGDLVRNGSERSLSRSSKPLLALAWAVGMAMAASGALAQAPGDADADKVPERPSARIESADGVAVVRLSLPGGASSVTGYYQFVENGRKIELTLKNSGVSDLKIDGQAVPTDRATIADDRITIKDADGSVLFEHQFGSDDAGLASTTSKSLRLQHSAPRNRERASTQSGPLAEPPKVMLGVQMIGVPDVLRGHLGLEKGTGVLVSAVHEGLPAAKAGLKPYDVILSAGTNNKIDESALRAMLRELGPGQTLDMTVIQKGETKKLTVMLEAYDAAKLEAAKAESISAIGPTDGPQMAFLQDLPLIGAHGTGPSASMPPDVAALVGPDNMVWSWSNADPTDSPEFRERLDKIMAQALERARAAQGLHSQAQADAEQAGADFEAAQKQMRERMERMEKMLEEMMRRQQDGAAQKPADKQS